MLYNDLMTIDDYHNGYDSLVEEIEDTGHVQECSVCGGLLVEMGRLGQLIWLKCRNCGIDCNVRSE